MAGKHERPENLWKSEVIGCTFDGPCESCPQREKFGLSNFGTITETFVEQIINQGEKLNAPKDIPRRLGTRGRANGSEPWVRRSGYHTKSKQEMSDVPENLVDDIEEYAKELNGEMEGQE